MPLLELSKENRMLLKLSAYGISQFLLYANLIFSVFSIFVPMALPIRYFLMMFTLGGSLLFRFFSNPPENAWRTFLFLGGAALTLGIAATLVTILPFPLAGLAMLPLTILSYIFTDLFFSKEQSKAVQLSPREKFAHLFSIFSLVGLAGAWLGLAFAPLSFPALITGAGILAGITAFLGIASWSCLKFTQEKRTFPLFVEGSGLGCMANSDKLTPANRPLPNFSEVEHTRLVTYEEDRDGLEGSHRGGVPVPMMGLVHPHPVP